MTYNVKIMPNARQDVRENARWYFETSHSREIADQWVDRLLSTLDSLNENPQRHALAREDSIFEFELRELTFGSGRRKTHRILFRVQDDTVEVLAIRHHAQRDVTIDDI